MTRAEFKALFDKHFDAVRNYIYYKSGDPDLATDIAQDTFLTLWEKQLNIDNEGSTKGLIFKIAHDNFISSYRKEKVSANFKLSLSESINMHTPEAVMQFDELKAKYERSLREMPEKQRVVFLMSRMDKLKYHEIAEMNGITVKAVEKRMKNALSFLRQGLSY